MTAPLDAAQLPDPASVHGAHAGAPDAPDANANNAPRWRVEDGPIVHIEEAMPGAAVNALRDIGHEVVVADRFSTDFGRSQIILKTEGGYIAGSEWRTDGQAVGF